MGFFGVEIFFFNLQRSGIFFFLQNHFFKTQSAFRMFFSAHVRDRKYFSIKFADRNFFLSKKPLQWIFPKGLLNVIKYIC